MRSQEERNDERRRALLRAGIELLGAADGPAVNVRAVCGAAGLTERYFYQCFGDRDSFVRSVYEHVAREAHDALADTSGDPARAVDTFVTLMVDDPTRGRVLLIAPFADQALSSAGVGAVPAFVGLVSEHLPADLDEVDRRLTATAVVGALTGLFTSYLRGELDVDRDRFVEHCVRVTQLHS
jgi:AcrR family transcriptional regulator